MLTLSLVITEIGMFFRWKCFSIIDRQYIRREELRRQKQQILYAIKVKSYTNHPSGKVFLDHWTNHYCDYKVGTEPIYMKVSEFFSQCSIDIEPIIN